MRKIQLSDEVKIESYPKRKHEAIFDRVDLLIKFIPGLNGTGAIVHSFIDAISAHDCIVKSVEEKMDRVDLLRRVHQKKSRLFRNLDSAWNIMLDNAVNFNEYVELLPKMKNITSRLEQITDSKIRAEVLSEYSRFQTLHPLCSKQLVIYETYSKARNERDEAMKTLCAAELDLMHIKDAERQLSLKISNDHILADEQKQTVSQLFPNVHVGHILSRINGESVEDLTFDVIIRKINRLKSPQTAEFLRYDYRYNSITKEWLSLEELRALGVCLEDPMLQRLNFINLAAIGDIVAVSDLLMQGFDPDGCDYAGSSALHHATANRHSDIVELLVKVSGNVDCRDKNMMTPLLLAISCGYMEMVRLLLDLGADRDCSDKNHRNTIYYAVLSGNDTVLRMFLRPERCNEPDKLWGFTPLHLAANQGNLSTVKFLLEFGSSLYCCDQQGRSAEEVARECGHDIVADYLQNEMLTAPGQLLYRDKRSGVSLWIGDESALESKWLTQLDVTSVFYFSESDDVSLNSKWLKNSSDIEFHHLMAEYKGCWWDFVNSILTSSLQRILHTLQNKSPVSILICDKTCDNISPAIYSAVCLVKYQIRVRDSLQKCISARPSVTVSSSTKKGLDQFQKLMDDKMLARLDSQLRHSNVMSTAF